MLLVGAMLAPGKRTVTSCLRIIGLSQERRFVNYHRVLSRARWSGRAASRLLLGLLVQRLVPEGPIVLGVDDTIERRRGKHIQAKGIYRDPVRSSHSHFVKASGLRWVSLMLLAPVPWAARTWALPFLTCLAPSERYMRKHRRRHKPVLDWARQMILQAQRWLPNRDLVVVGDSAFSALEWLHALVQQNITVITRLRWRWCINPVRDKPRLAGWLDRTRCEIGIRSCVMRLITKQAIRASFVCAGRARARKRGPIRVW